VPNSPIHQPSTGLGKGSQAFDFWAAQIHLPYLQASPDFEVTAICNSTVESAQASIDFHKLPRTVKAYGSVNDLTLDANVDMVLISVRVGAHYELSKPLIESGKDLFVEWPLAATPEEAEELVETICLYLTRSANRIAFYCRIC
jgi:predicted dehydrogenase